MIQHSDRSLALLLALCGLFTGFFVTGDIIGAKLFSFSLFGLTPASFGLGGGAFVATVGIFAFPLTFLLTDIINEYYGKRVVRQFTFVAIAVMLLLQLVLQAAIHAPAVSFTAEPSSDDWQRAYSLALGQSWMIVAGSTAAFAVGQLLDVHVFSWLRRCTGGRWLWLRAQGSTLISQLIDTIAVLGLAFVILPAVTGAQEPWGAALFFTVVATNYLVKVVISVASTPVLYLVHYLVELWLGRPEARRLAQAAHDSATAP